MGLLGLKCLYYFAKYESKYVRLYLKREYPLACTSINLTKYLIDELTETEQKESKLKKLFISEQNSEGFFVRCFKENRCVIFEEIFVRIFKLFDYIWSIKNATYMKFGEIMGILDKHLYVYVYKKKPKNLEEFDIDVLCSLNKI